MSLKLAGHRGACRQVSQVHEFIAFGFAVCLSVALVQPAQAMRPEHHLVGAALSQASARKVGVRSAPSGPHVPTVAAVSPPVPTVVTLSFDVDASGDAKRPLASTRGKLGSAPKVPLHLPEAQHFPGQNPAINQILVSKDMDWQALQTGSRGAKASAVLPESISLVVSGRNAAAPIVEVPTLPEPAQVAADPAAELSMLPECQDGSDQSRIGCKGSCRCRWHQQCYTKRSNAAPFANTGMCGLSMKMMALVTVAASGLLLLFTVTMRLWLQHRDFLYEHEQRSLRRPTVMVPISGASFLDEFEAKRRMVHEQGLVRKSLGHFSEDPATSARREIFSEIAAQLRRGDD